jgi:hypothetical protein
LDSLNVSMSVAVYVEDVHMCKLLQY